MRPIKINAVVIRGFNDDELIDLVLCTNEWFEMRFIEYMDVWKCQRLDSGQTLRKRNA